jgi:hypothetical protein
MAGLSQERVVLACKGTLPAVVLEGLLMLELGEGDFLAAVYAELMSHGVDDPEAFLISKGIAKKA